MFSVYVFAETRKRECRCPFLAAVFSGRYANGECYSQMEWFDINVEWEDTPMTRLFSSKNSFLWGNISHLAAKAICRILCDFLHKFCFWFGILSIYGLFERFFRCTWVLPMGRRFVPFFILVPLFIMSRKVAHVILRCCLTDTSIRMLLTNC